MADFMLCIIQYEKETIKNSISVDLENEGWIKKQKKYS